jgi:hypothetical protein
LIERVVDKMGADRASELVGELNSLIEVANEALAVSESGHRG